jgi:P pilus assembly chaperone PapD
MLRSQHGFVVAALAFCSALAGGAEPARAAGSDLNISPIMANIASNERSTTLSAINDGDTPLRVAITPRSWSQSDLGEMQLAATDQLAVFPRNFTIPAHGARQIRVAYLGSARNSEQDFRLNVEQLPEFRPQTEPGAHITFTIDFNIPIFVAPLNRRTSAQLTDGTITAGSAAFSVANTGTTHVLVSAAHVTGLEAGEHVAFERDLKGWYVLPGGKRTFTVALDHCDQLKVLHIEATAGDAKLQEFIDVHANDCKS